MKATTANAPVPPVVPNAPKNNGLIILIVIIVVVVLGVLGYFLYKQFAPTPTPLTVTAPTPSPGPTPSPVPGPTPSPASAPVPGPTPSGLPPGVTQTLADGRDCFSTANAVDGFGYMDPGTTFTTAVSGCKADPQCKGIRGSGVDWWKLTKVEDTGAMDENNTHKCYTVA